MLKNPIRVMIAEDTLEAREILIDEINKLNQGYAFEIVQCESPNTAFNKLSEYSKKGKYFDVIFADIDFQEARTKGGKRDSGFEIISKAFETCPFTKICTYSGQFREFDLSDQHQELVKKGLVEYSFDKSHRIAGQKDWFRKGFIRVLTDVERDLLVWDLWGNSQKMIEIARTINLKTDKLQNSKIQFEIIENIKSIYRLIPSLMRTQDTTNLISGIKIYHNILEIICKGDKSDNQIIIDSDHNKAFHENAIRRSLKFDQRVSALRIIAAFTKTDYFRYGYKLNGLRNDIMHVDRNFIPDFANFIFSHVVLCLYILGNQTSISNIKQFSSSPSNLNLGGLQDLKDLIQYIEKL